MSTLPSSNLVTKKTNCVSRVFNKIFLFFLFLSLAFSLFLKDFFKTGIFEELILSFSVIANWRSISDKSVGGDTISCIHGLRALSMLWIILGLIRV